jgi:hypothetical protein
MKEPDRVQAPPEQDLPDSAGLVAAVGRLAEAVAVGANSRPRAHDIDPEASSSASGWSAERSGSTRSLDSGTPARAGAPILDQLQGAAPRHLPG